MEETLDTRTSFQGYKANLAPALVVVLISVPLSMGIAIASGVPPVRGLITAIVGGLVIGRLAGSPLQISGPSAGLAVMVLDLVDTHGLEALAVVVPLMGLLQASAGLLRLGQLFRAVSPAVINGMLAGIGVLIFSAQFHVMVDDVPKGSGLANILSIPEAVYKGLAPTDDTVHHWAALIGVLTLGVMMFWAAMPLGRLKKLPAPLVAVTVATGAVVLFDLPIRRVDMPDSLWDAFAPPHPAAFAGLLDPSMLIAAVALAFVASAETLLCATAVDAMHSGPRTDYNREMIAQGVGNMICGLLGAMPVTGVITRSSANVQAGAKSRESAIMVGALLLVVMLAGPRLLEVIPRASLAGLLVYIGVKLVRGRDYAELKRYGRSEFAVFAITVAVIVGVNLLTGIVVGLALSLAKGVHAHGLNFHRLEVEVTPDPRTQQVHVHLRGAASFVRIPKLASALKGLPWDREVLLHVQDLEYIDHACLALLGGWEEERMRKRAPVRVQWQTLEHRYHAKNPLDRTPEQHVEAPDADRRLLDFLTAERVMVAPKFADKWAAIRALSEKMAELDSSLDVDELEATVRAREEESPTCLGRGLMIPHGKLPPGGEMTGVLALSAQGWDFDPPDDERVKFVLLLATPDNEASRHLSVLAAFARLCIQEPPLVEAMLAQHQGHAVIRLLKADAASSVNYAFESRSGG